jgi:signal transduction histidine kinase
VGDPVRLNQVFVNLLNNATTYAPRHGRIMASMSVNAWRLVSVSATMDRA